MKGDLLSAFARDGLPLVTDSAISMILEPGDQPPDPAQCLEIGAMILLDKPILVVVLPGRSVTPGLRRHADLVVELPGNLEDPESQRIMEDALTRMVGIAKERAAS